MTDSDFDANGHPAWVHNESLAPFRQMLEHLALLMGLLF